MFDFGKKITYEEFKDGSFKGFLLECPEEVRQHILLCISCQQSMDPLFRLMYDALINDKIFDMVDKINEDITTHIKKYKKINKNWLDRFYESR